MPLRFGAVDAKASIWMKVLLLFVSLVMLMPLYLSVKTIWGVTNLGYTIAGENLQITYAWERESIPLAAIDSAEVVNPIRLSRRNGNNTPGNYSGHWISEETGRIELYATRLDSLVVIKTAEGTWGLTPAEPAAFVGALKSGTAGSFPVAAGDGNPLWLILFLSILPLVMLPGIGWMIRLLYRFPRRLAYVLEPQELVIETGWRPVRVPYAEIESVEETTLKGWPMRIYGSEIKGVHWGLFTWSAVPGKRIYLYATQLKPIVLIRAGKRSFGLSPADASGFVAALAAQIPR